MAIESIAVTPGVGRDVAVDTVAGKDWPLVKVAWGSDGVATLVEQATPLPTDIRDMPAGWRETDSVAAALMSDAIMVEVAGVPTKLTPKFFSETVAASDTDEVLVAAVASKKIRVVALVVHCGATATTATFESSTTTRKHKVPAGANGGEVLPFNPAGWFETASGESLTVTTGAGSDTEISGTYVEV